MATERDRSGRDRSGERDTAGAGDPTGARDEGQPVPDDPLGLGGVPDADAPSRRPRPKVIALLGEFFRMSRTTAILLAVFVVVGALYLVVRAEPVVQFGTPGPAEPTETAPATPTEETGPEETDQTTVPTSPGEITSPSSTPGVTSDDDEADTTPRNNAPAEPTFVPEGPGAGGATPTGPTGGGQGTGAGGGQGASPADSGAGGEALAPDAE